MLVVAGGIVLAWLALQVLAVIGDMIVSGRSMTPEEVKLAREMDKHP